MSLVNTIRQERGLAARYLATFFFRFPYIDCENDQILVSKLAFDAVQQ